MTKFKEFEHLDTSTNYNTDGLVSFLKANLIPRHTRLFFENKKGTRASLWWKAGMTKNHEIKWNQKY